MLITFNTENKIRLDDFLRLNLPSVLIEKKIIEKDVNLSNSKIRRLIISGSVLVNGKTTIRPAYELRGKSKIQLSFDEHKFFYEKQPDDIKYEVSDNDVLYEDEYIICLNKPSKFPTEETIVGGEKRDNLHDALVRYLWKRNPDLRNPPYAGIMHRLDRETSGVILFTKQRCINKEIQAMFESHNFTKIYVLLCAGNFKRNDFPAFLKVEKFMGRISSKSQQAKWGFLREEKGGLYSKTDFTLIDKGKYKNNEVFLVEAKLYTGRTHQIRVHISEAGFPILGDTLYGGSVSERIMLHAKLLEFIHPINKSKIRVEAPVPFILDKPSRA